MRPLEQRELAFDDDCEESRALRKLLLKAARDVYESHPDHKKAMAGELGMTSSALCDCFEERTGHYLDFRQWCQVISHDDRGIVASALCLAHGFEEPTRRPVLSPEDENEVLKDLLGKSGPAGAGILAEARRRGVKL